VLKVLLAKKRGENYVFKDTDDGGIRGDREEGLTFDHMSESPVTPKRNEG